MYRISFEEAVVQDHPLPVTAGAFIPLARYQQTTVIQPVATPFICGDACGYIDKVILKSLRLLTASGRSMKSINAAVRIIDLLINISVLGDQ